MGVEVDVVTKPEYDGRNELVDERFDRGKERIECLEDISKQMVNLSIQFAEIIKTDHEKAAQVIDDVNDLKGVSSKLSIVVQELQKKDEDKEARLREVEKMPAKKYDKLMGWIYGTIVTGVIGYLLSLVFKMKEVSP